MRQSALQGFVNEIVLFGRMTSEGALYEFAVDHEARLFRVTLRGQWTLAQVEAYHRDRSALLIATGWTSGSFDCLTDVRQSGVQPKEVAAAQSKALARIPITPRRFAVLVQSMLAKHQANRVNDCRNRQFFANEPEALAWLSDSA